jgi:hypothetical protein
MPGLHHCQYSQSMLSFLIAFFAAWGCMVLGRWHLWPGGLAEQPIIDLSNDDSICERAPLIWIRLFLAPRSFPFRIPQQDRRCQKHVSIDHTTSVERNRKIFEIRFSAEVADVCIPFSWSI